LGNARLLPIAPGQATMLGSKTTAHLLSAREYLGGNMPAPALPGGAKGEVA
jgi:hypothetical protein